MSGTRKVWELRRVRVANRQRTCMDRVITCEPSVGETFPRWSERLTRKVRPHAGISSAAHRQSNLPSTTSRQPLSNAANMGGVSVRDVPADKFIEAYAAFLKRQGKLPIPGP